MSETDDEVYTVEKIVDHKEVDGKTFFRVRWEGYFAEEDTWEPYENLSKCTQAIDEYRKVLYRGDQNELHKNVPDQLPACLELPNPKNSSDSDAGGANVSKGLRSTVLKITSSKDENSSSAQAKQCKKKKFQRISIITSSESEDEGHSSTKMKTDLSGIRKEKRTGKVPEPLPNQALGSQKQTAKTEKTNKAVEILPNQTLGSQKQTAKTEKTNKAVEILSNQASGLHKHVKAKNRVPETVDNQSKHSTKGMKKLANDASSVRVDCNPAVDRKPSSVQMKEKSNLPKSDHGAADCEPAPQKSMQKQRAKSVEDNIMDVDPKLRKPSKSMQKQRAKSVEDDIMDVDPKPRKPSKSMQKQKAKSVEDDIMDVDPKPHKPSKSVLKQERAKSVEDDIMDVDPKPRKPSKSMPKQRTRSLQDDMEVNPKPRKPNKTFEKKSEKKDSAELHSNASHDFLKKFTIPKRKVSVDPANKETLSPKPVSVTQDKPDASHKFSKSYEQPKDDQQFPASDVSEIRSESATVKSASLKDRHVSNSLIGEQCENSHHLERPTPKFGAVDGVVDIPKPALDKDPSRLSVGMGELSVSSVPQDSSDDQESNGDCPSVHQSFLDEIVWTPPTEDDQDCSEVADETSNSTGLNPFPIGPLPTKTSDGPKRLDSDVNLPLPPWANTEVKTKTDVKFKVSEEDITTLHDHAKNGRCSEIETWYGTPGRLFDWELVNPRGSSILMQAAHNGVKKVVEFLVVNGANVNACLPNKKTVMMVVCDSNSNEAARLDIIDILITFGAKLNMALDNGVTALMLACKKGNRKIVKCLLDSGADFYAKTKEVSPLKKSMTAVDFAKAEVKNNPSNPEAHLEIMKMITTLEAKVTAAFESQIELVLNKCCKLLDPLFDACIFSLNEGELFTMSFDYKIQQYEADTALILFVAHALIDTEAEIKCRMYGDLSAVRSVKLNGVQLVGVTAESDHVLSLHPVIEGENELKFHTMDLQNSDIKLIVRAFRVQLLPQNLCSQ